VSSDFERLLDEELKLAVADERLGMRRAGAIEELAKRALANPTLLGDVYAVIRSERTIGMHTLAPLGWLAADVLFLSGQEGAIRGLLQDMSGWTAPEQEDLVRHWAGKGRLSELTEELMRRYGWMAAYAK